MTETPISLADLRKVAEASARFPSNPDPVGLDYETVLALVEAVSAALALNYGSFGQASRDRLAVALSRFVSEQPPNGDKSSETGA